ncbi:UDP-3-O-[3-hydroxymyristoyl] glucosamine N-acyltransferase [Amycolatopsis arida]|uniref:UDP-3-O-acylglucosamine N-acyltransferase n=1 Tax=Amycolatopsis arida TaxID=587909 RepID=A0A1I5L9G5_9PSEU|nr:UDP-3-O-(3-hydroxymyristoyl)glucosamine N-acyltransferase [Amycolatopsis arida]TDX93641.1 UDP-3-O-[3-hydroxymyristoyl] glucosamine N-acyltransferase [Amycolatopsis arida]SFO94014.1 UDP-3-O-[3-hydroxymyristoyl] glucosamine N-acyltransferase [Amycolatopsis arida]
MPTGEYSDRRWTLADLASLLHATVGAAPDFVVQRPASADSDDPHGLAFCESERYLKIAEHASVGAVILPTGSAIDGKPYLTADDPRTAFEKFLTLCKRPLPLATGIHPTAIIHPDSHIHDTAAIGAYVVVERAAVIEPGARIFPFCYVGESCLVGTGSVLYPHVVLYQDVALGQHCTMHSHATLGADGFGFSWDGNTWRKVEQIGRVTIGDNVEIGAGTTIDRATTEATTVAAGTKLDNLVHIAHNVSIGPHSALAAQAGIAGSAVLGQRVTLGGQTGIADHTVVGDDVTLAGRTATSRDLLRPGAYYGNPAMPLPEGLRVAALLAQLPRLHDRIQALETALAERGDNTG